MAILCCSFDSLNLRFLHGMTFNHWEPNLSCTALNLLKSGGSSHKLSLQLRCPVPSISCANSIFLKFKPPFKLIIIGSHAPNQNFELRLFARFAATAKALKASRLKEENPSHLWLPRELLVKNGYYLFSH